MVYPMGHSGIIIHLNILFWHFQFKLLCFFSFFCQIDSILGLAPDPGLWLICNKLPEPQPNPPIRCGSGDSRVSCHKSSNPRLPWSLVRHNAWFSSSQWGMTDLQLLFSDLACYLSLPLISPPHDVPTFLHHNLKFLPLHM